MSALTALLLATPLFGFSLEVDTSLAEPPASIVIDVDAVLAVTVPTQLDEPGEPTTADLVRRRAKIANVHKWLGISTWAMMTVTVALGIVQYYNLYGGAKVEDTPCVKGDALLGQKSCDGQPLPHLITASLTGALYFTTFGLSFAMPDPLGVSEGDSKFAKRLRTHKILRWVTFGGMLAQILLGVIISNSEAFGLDRANNYGALRALATTHLAIGGVTYGALTWAGAIMLR